MREGRVRMSFFPSPSTGEGRVRVNFGQVFRPVPFFLSLRAKRGNLGEMYWPITRA